MAAAGLGGIACKVTVQGRAQGVFFRDNTRRQATLLGVRGWVRNRHDGSVEALFEGEAEAVQALIEFCRRSPGSSHVESLNVEEIEPQGFTDFEVRLG